MQIPCTVINMYINLTKEFLHNSSHNPYMYIRYYQHLCKSISFLSNNIDNIDTSHAKIIEVCNIPRILKERLGFQIFDKHGRGYICASDLRAVLQCLGEDLSEEESMCLSFPLVWFSSLFFCLLCFSLFISLFLLSFLDFSLLSSSLLFCFLLFLLRI